MRRSFLLLAGALAAILFLFFFLFLIKPAATAPAAPTALGATLVTYDYYVAPGGDDAGACQSPTSPCATIGSASGRAPAGATISVSAGIYLEHLTIVTTQTLVGAGPEQTIVDGSGGGGGRPLLVNSGIAAVIRGMAFRNGSAYDGGGVLNRGTLTLEDVHVYGNSATEEGGGIANKQTLTMTGGKITDNTAGNFGGGLLNKIGTVGLDAHAWLSEVTVSGNSVTSRGGGIYNADLLTITHSLIAGNESLLRGGGLENIGGGTLNLANSTIAENVTDGDGGGIYHFNGTTRLNNVTIADNLADRDTDGGDGGGIYHYADTVYFRNTILDRNYDGSQNAVNCAGTLTSLDYNLVGGLSADCTIAGSTANSYDLTSAQLGTLADNGGPTLTYALGASSPAIDAGDNGTCEVDDQRRAPRPFDGDAAGPAVCDIGAFEFGSEPPQPGPNLVVETLALSPTLVTETVDFSGWVTLVIANAGDLAVTGPYSISLFSANEILGGRELLANGTFAGPALAPGESVAVSLPAGLSVPAASTTGPRLLAVQLDSGAAVAETNEDDNVASTPLFVLPTGPYVWLVDSTADDLSFVTLRFALTHLRPGDQVTFDGTRFPQGAPATIPLASPLPEIGADDVVVDGSGAGVVVDGSSLSAGSGFVFRGDDVALRNLTVQNMPGHGVWLSGDGAVVGEEAGGACDVGRIGGPPATPATVIAGNGADGIVLDGNYGLVSAVAVRANGQNGIVVASFASDVGVARPGGGNEIAGNGEAGVLVRAPARSVDVFANHIGTDYAGGTGMPNAFGVFLDEAGSFTHVGGDENCQGNLISGNRGWGIRVRATGAGDTLLVGNVIGRGGNNEPLGNGGGIWVEDSANVLIGGARQSKDLCDGACNLIGDNTGTGVLVSGASSTDVTLAGNFIGTLADGRGAAGNGNHGVHVSGAGGVEIGISSSAHVDNLISANTGAGILIDGNAVETTVRGAIVGLNIMKDAPLGNDVGIHIAGGAEGTRVKSTAVGGNRGNGIEVGPSVDTHVDYYNHVGDVGAQGSGLGNGGDGISLVGADGAEISYNEIGRNGGAGISLDGSSGNRVRVNKIGYRAGYLLGNASHGIVVANDSRDNLLEDNWLGDNGGDGIRVEGSGSTGNTLAENDFYQNQRRRIENISGGNTELAPPQVTSIQPGSGEGRWTIVGQSCAGCTVQLYRRYVPTRTVYVKDVAVNASGTFTFTDAPTFDGVFDFLATDAAGNSSEFTGDLYPYLDLYITGIEVTQAIQTPEHDIPLIADKETVVRVHVRSANIDVANVGARLEASRGGVILANIKPVGDGCAPSLTVKRYPDRSAIGDSFCFRIPSKWAAAGDLDLAAAVNLPATYLESSYVNNTRGTTVTFAEFSPLSVRVFLIRHPEQPHPRGRLAELINEGDRIALGDIDGDGMHELLHGDVPSQTVEIHENTQRRDIEENGSFNPGYTTGNELVAGDLEGDGTDEVVIARDEDGLLEVWGYDSASEAWSQLVTYDVGFQKYQDLALGDLDGDGTDEIVIGRGSSAVIDVYRLVDYEQNPPFTVTSLSGGSHGYIADVAVANMEGSNSAEEIIVGNIASDLFIYHVSGNTLVQDYAGVTTWSGNSQLAVGDIDRHEVGGEHYAEILIANPVSGRVTFFAWDGSTWERIRSYDGWWDQEGSVFSAGGDLLVGTFYSDSPAQDIVTSRPESGSILFQTKNQAGEWRVHTARAEYADAMLDLTERMFPIPHVQRVSVETVALGPLEGPPRNSRLYEKMGLARQGTGDDYSSYISIVEGDGDLGGGQAYFSPQRHGVFSVSESAIDGTNPGALVVGPHEIGHTRDRQHADQAWCGPAGIQFAYPRAYIAYPGDMDTIQILDVADPQAPQPVGSEMFVGFPQDILVDGSGLAYVANYINDPLFVDGLGVVDTTFPDFPNLITAEPLGGGSRRLALDVANQRAFVADTFGGLHVVDVAAAANPVLLDSWIPPDKPEDEPNHDGVPYVFDVAFGNGHLFMVDRPHRLWGGGRLGGKLRIFTVGAGGALSLLAEYEPEGWPNGLTLEGTLAYVADDAGFTVVDVANPAAPVALVREVVNRKVLDLVVDGGIATLITPEGVRTYDVSAPATPQPLATLNLDGVPTDMDVGNGFIYISAGRAGVFVVDSNDPTSLGVVARYDPPHLDWRVEGLDYHDGLLYLAAWESGSTGFDRGDPAANQPARAIDPYTHFELMSYCNPQWISPFNYDTLRTEINDSHPAPTTAAAGPALAADRQAAADTLTVAGTAQLLLGEGQLQRVALEQLPLTANLPLTSPVELALRASGGGLLVSYPISVSLPADPESLVDASSGIFNLTVPWDPEAALISLLLDGTEVASRTVSATPPAVRVDYPNGGETLSGTETIHWRGEDGDGDPLTYDVFYSADAGVTWSVLAAALPGDSGGGSLEVDVDTLAGTGAGVIRVVANDGVLTAADSSDGKFTVVEKPPRLYLQSPASGRQLYRGDSLLLLAEAFDPDGAPLYEDSYRWTSSLDGPLGQGPELIVDDLSPGTHLIEVTVEDAGGDVARATATVVVAEVPVCSAPAPVIPALAIGFEGDEIRLSWPGEVANEGGVEVWRSPAPVFAGEEVLVDRVRDAGFTLPAAETAFYRVVGTNGCGLPSAPSQEVGVFTFSLAAP